MTTARDEVIDVRDTVDSGEFADLIQVKARTILNYLQRARRPGYTGKFPLPVIVKGDRPLWRRSDVEQYAASRMGKGWEQKGDKDVIEYLRNNPGAAGPVGTADQDPAPGQP